MHHRLRICRLTALQNNYFCVFSNCKNRMTELCVCVCVFLLLWHMHIYMAHTCSHIIKCLLRRWRRRTRERKTTKRVHISGEFFHSEGGKEQQPKFRRRSFFFFKQWGLIHISVYSAVTGMGWESGVKTQLKDKTFSPFYFFFSAHLRAIVCVFLALVNWKTIMLCFPTWWSWPQVGEERVW